MKNKKNDLLNELEQSNEYLKNIKDNLLTKKDIKLKDKLKEKLKDKIKKKAFKRNQSNKTIVKSMRFTNKQLKKIETQMKKTNRSFTNYIIWRLFK